MIVSEVLLIILIREVSSITNSNHVLVWYILINQIRLFLIF